MTNNKNGADGTAERGDPDDRHGLPFGLFSLSQNAILTIKPEDRCRFECSFSSPYARKPLDTCSPRMTPIRSSGESSAYPFATGIQKAFTLVELLIVVAIISTLTVIAVVNFAASSERSKVSRVLSDLKTIGAAVETYRTDHGRPPRMAHFDFYGDPLFDIINGEPCNGVMSKSLSTPVAYLTIAHLSDPFAGSANSVDEKLYTYQDILAYQSNNPESVFWGPALEFYGDWRAASVGPDGGFDHGFQNSAQLLYDPTNGVKSKGNLWFSQRNIAIQPTTVELLGEHE